MGVVQATPILRFYRVQLIEAQGGTNAARNLAEDGLQVVVELKK